jgi:signal transduction histidine kinase
LTGLRWDLEEIDGLLSAAATKTDMVELPEKMVTILRLVDDMVDTVRRISSELRPSILDDMGLVATIEWAAKQFEVRTGIIARFESSVENIELTREQSTAIFRIFQEALTNVLRHADATRIDVTMKEQKGTFVLQVRDNGKGMREADKSGTETLGLVGMRERAHLIRGEVSITSAKGQGTVVTVQVPIAGREIVLE